MLEISAWKQDDYDAKTSPVGYNQDLVATSAPLTVGGGSGPTSGATIQRQVPTKESGTRDHHVPRQGELGAGGVSAAHAGDQRAEEKKGGNIGAQRVHRTDPALAARHLRPVASACEGRRPGRRQSGGNQERCGAT